MGKRFAILIGVAALGVMALGASGPTVAAADVTTTTSPGPSVKPPASAIKEHPEAQINPDGSVNKQRTAKKAELSQEPHFKEAVALGLRRP